tara:strand:- start:499 stop:1473 length:975 start_codon:yes stop_codon:yes gene_type:complete
MIQSHLYNYSRTQFVELYKEFAPNASESTFLTFDSALKRVEKLYGDNIEKLKLKFVDNPNDIVEKFKTTDYSKNTLYSTINMINKLIIMLDAPLILKKRWADKVKELTTERDNNLLDNQKSKTENVNWIEYGLLKRKMEDKYKRVISNLDIKPNDFRNFLILSLYCFMPPARLGNYLHCKVIRENTTDLPSTHNYIIIKNLDTLPTFYFVFNKYKTAKTLGTQMNKIEDDNLSELLKIYFTKYNTDNEYFLTCKGIELSPPTLTNILKKESHAVCGKYLSVDLLRHIYISHFLSQNPSLRDKLNVAGIMGQSYSINQQDLYNRK